ncbi:hypothetical protein Tco_0517702 [Tanacetum coccineum]
MKQTSKAVAAAGCIWYKMWLDLHLFPFGTKERAVGGHNWLDMMIVYFDEYAYEQREFTRRLNGLIGEMNEACADRIDFVQELWSVAGESVPAKTVVFLEEMMNKEGGREWQLAGLVKEGRERVRKIELFVGKLMRDARG